MIISQTAVYALKAVLYLAETTTGTPVRVDDIAASLGVPRNYLSKILHSLTRSGVLESTRGPGGGFRLAIRPEDLVLARVIGDFDDLVSSSPCLLGREECRDDNPCAAHARWKGASAAVRTFFLETTIADLSRIGVTTILG